LADAVPHFDDVTISVGGEVTGYVQINHQTQNDLLVMEAIAVPLSFVALVWVFPDLGHGLGRILAAWR